MPWSVVSKTSSSFSARVSNSPFFFESQPRSRTVTASTSSGSHHLSRRSNISSRSTRTHGLLHDLARHFQVRHRLLAAYPRKPLQEIVQAVPRGQVVPQVLHGYSRPGEY